MTIAPGTVPSPAPADTAVATAWTQRRLIFDRTPLPEAAAEFNRYNTRKLIVDAMLEDFRVSGSFSSTDPAALLRFLRVQPGLLVREADSRIEISQH